MLSELRFAAALVYSPRGQSAESKKSRVQVRDPLKRGDPRFLQLACARLRTFLPHDLVAEFLPADGVLVPTPRRAPQYSKDSLWPAQLLAEALVRCGFGDRVLPCLARVSAVPKSAFSAPGHRPDPVHHYESMRVRLDLLDRPRRVTLIDDFVTRGATLLAPASRLQEALPGAEIRAFVLVRTMGLVAEIESIGAPCAGTIRCDGKVVERHP